MITFSHSLMPLMIHRELLGRGQAYLKFSPAENLCAHVLSLSYSPRVPPSKGPFAVSEAICQHLPSAGSFSSPSGLPRLPAPVWCPPSPSVSVTTRSGSFIRKPKTIMAPTG